jgi:hypothetical protein
VLEAGVNGALHGATEFFVLPHKLRAVSPGRILDARRANVVASVLRICATLSSRGRRRRLGDDNGGGDLAG